MPHDGIVVQNLRPVAALTAIADVTGLAPRIGNGGPCMPTSARAATSSAPRLRAGRAIAQGFAASLAAVVLAAGPAASAEFPISGSTTVQTRILEPLASDILAATGLAIKVEGVGSGNGLKRLFGGQVPVAIISAELKDLLARANVADDGTYRQHVLLEDVIVPIVNASNPVAALSWEQLKGLYSGKIKNWSEVGGPNLPVRVVTSHPESATREVVWELVMAKADYHRSARIVYATKKEMVLVAESAGAVGAVSQAFVDQYLADIARHGEPPEIKVVATKRISRPLAMVTKGEPDPQVAKLLAFLRSDKARAKFK